ncbi:MAG: hypothetical protein KDC34_19975, partial [Saprospiraceae bacterium]|nr:hypothetical protein [Saprospiraceae bacterium]
MFDIIRPIQWKQMPFAKSLIAFLPGIYIETLVEIPDIITGILFSYSLIVLLIYSKTKLKPGKKTTGTILLFTSFLFLGISTPIIHQKINTLNHYSINNLNSELFIGEIKKKKEKE